MQLPVPRSGSRMQSLQWLRSEAPQVRMASAHAKSRSSRCREIDSVSMYRIKPSVLKGNNDTTSWELLPLHIAFKLSGHAVNPIKENQGQSAGIL
jgi:hypothetical protein